MRLVRIILLSAIFLSMITPMVLAVSPWEGAQPCSNYDLVGLGLWPVSLQYPPGGPECGTTDARVSWYNDELTGPGNIQLHRILGYNIYRTPDTGSTPVTGTLLGPASSNPYRFAPGDDIEGRFYWMDTNVIPGMYDYIMVVWTAGQPGTTGSDPAPGCYEWVKITVPDCPPSQVPEFPSLFIPAVFICGLFGVAFYLRRIKQN